MKTAMLTVLCAAAVFIIGCGTTEKPVTLADLHPATPGTTIYNPTNNTTTISNEGFTWTLRGALTNVVMYPAHSPRPIPESEFDLLLQLQNPDTAISVKYLGQKDGYAYLRVRSIPIGHPKQWTDNIVYVNLAELAPEFRDTLPTNQPR
jgi:hypothetical protein